ncbi:hypothetical protein JCM11251_002988 [Rhodosporidiobolus azoricus]
MQHIPPSSPVLLAPQPLRPYDRHPYSAAVADPASSSSDEEGEQGEAETATSPSSSQQSLAHRLLDAVAVAASPPLSELAPARTSEMPAHDGGGAHELVEEDER